MLGDPFIRFYAGAPLEVLSGHRLGTLCVIDRSPRLLSETQVAALTALSRQAEPCWSCDVPIRAWPTRCRASASSKDSFPSAPTAAKYTTIGTSGSRSKSTGATHHQSVTHGICPDCAVRHFPDEAANLSAG